MYEIGQKVVCVKSHSQGIVKEGEIHAIEGIKLTCCNNVLVVDVGVLDTIKYTTCGTPVVIGKTYCCLHCNKPEPFDGKWWIAADLFRPLDDLYNTDIEELMNEVNERVPFEL